MATDEELIRRDSVLTATASIQNVIPTIKQDVITLVATRVLELQTEIADALTLLAVPNATDIPYLATTVKDALDDIFAELIALDAAITAVEVDLSLVPTLPIDSDDVEDTGAGQRLNITLADIDTAITALQDSLTALGLGISVDPVTYKVSMVANIASTSTATGTLVVTGGMGVSGAGYFGSYLSSLGQVWKYAAKTADYTLTANDHVILADSTAADVIITTPDAATVPGQVYIVKATAVGGFAITINPHAAQTIDGAATKVLSAQYEAVMFMSDGSNWVILGEI